MKLWFFNLVLIVSVFVSLGPKLQYLLKIKVDLKLRTESLAYENGHLENTETIIISCIL